MDISMDIHEKLMDMDMDVKFHIHGKPGHSVYQLGLKRRLLAAADCTV